jgi:hypothetical protein
MLTMLPSQYQISNLCPHAAIPISSHRQTSAQNTSQCFALTPAYLCQKDERALSWYIHSSKCSFSWFRGGLQFNVWWWRPPGILRIPSTLCARRRVLNTLRTGDANLRFFRFCITTVKDEWRKSAFLTRAWFPRTSLHNTCSVSPNGPPGRMFEETWRHSELMICDKYRGKNTRPQCVNITSHINVPETLWGRNFLMRQPGPKKTGPPTVGSGPGKKKKLLATISARSDRIKILILNQKDWPSVAVTCAGSERVNLYIRRIMTLPRQIKTSATQPGPGTPTGLPSPSNLCRVSNPLPSSALKRNEFV